MNPAPDAPDPRDEADAVRVRLQKLEALVAALQAAPAASGSPPAGFSPPLPAPVMLLGAADHTRRRWLDWAIIRELRFIAFMYLDPRYRLSRLGQFGIPGVLLATVLNYLVL